ncbi:LuxR C-terminal-related transcriptional regulator [Streptomyces sp. G-G2]|uniref:LuxR C-terminal-related transcriptional regulator n=1 Tax=Streptomyces sp. G-G2 TaxID=3046201 RepID=UPI0024B8E013|nr:LuxR C-terminal-related transcriptional regulator [Streptomyces sp. G-G2]MDJ0385323.1 LuxR C-terminal-related transcriptional regulator [Streptomyces sp. G-G2]
MSRTISELRYGAGPDGADGGGRGGGSGADGGGVRTVSALPLRMILVDRAHVLVPPDPADTRARAVVLPLPGARLGAHSPPSSNRSGRPLGRSVATARATVGAGLTPPGRELLRLLSRGMADEAVSHQLGACPSTVGRSTATLMKRFGARSRVEADLGAAPPGWL